MGSYPRRLYSSRVKVGKIVPVLNLILPLPGLELQPLGHPARSKLLYQLRHSGLVGEKILESKPDGTRKVGRLRLRWMEDVENDL
jgi:hypothetical protein